jgi:hypothetical protein
MIVSLEQIAIEQTLKHSNVIVNAVAGSGKTRTCIYIGAENPTKSVLILTYNAGLKIETRAAAAQYPNIEVHSFHSFANKYYIKCHTDDDLSNILKEDIRITPSKYDIILIDEVQDMTPLYFKLVKLIIKECKDAKVAVFGDVSQEINDYKGADSRYLTMFDSLISGLFSTNEKFARLNLSTSFRVPQEIAEFIYMNMNSVKINTVRSGGTIQYKIMNAYNSQKIYDEVFTPILAKYRCDDIFVLASTLSGNNSPIINFANIISKNNINIFVASDSRIEEDIIANKVCFSTFHQVKGLERSVVIVFGFDESYLFGKPTIDGCPNDLYVAATRSKQELILIHHYTKNYLPFMNPPRNKTGFLQLSKKRGLSESIENGRYSPRENGVNGISPKAITTFIKHIPATTLHEIMKYITVEEIRPCGKPIFISHKIPTLTSAGKVLIEPVSDINGVAIPLYYMYHVNGVVFADAAEHCLREATSMCSKSYTYRNRQLNSFKWINTYTFELCRERIASVVDSFYLDKMNQLNQLNQLEFEKEITYKNLVGKIDCYDNKNNIIYEFKCVNVLSLEHILQVALYSMMFPCSAAYIYNVLDDNLKKVSALNLDKIIELIESNNKKISDDEFLLFNINYNNLY